MLSLSFFSCPFSGSKETLQSAKHHVNLCLQKVFFLKFQVSSFIQQHLMKLHAITESTLHAITANSKG